MKSVEINTKCQTWTKPHPLKSKLNIFRDLLGNMSHVLDNSCFIKCLKTEAKKSFLMISCSGILGGV